MKRRYPIAGAVVLALAAGGVGIAQAVGGDDESESASGPGADKAKAAALKSTGGGTANEVERADENGAAWEVEVTKADGKTVDVMLDADYKRVVVKGDSESSETGGEHEASGSED